MIIYTNLFYNLFNVLGITLFPFIFLKTSFKDKEETLGYKILVNHEKIHIRQQLECGILFFFLIYGIEFFLKYWYYFDYDKTYRNLSFEIEAYKYETNLNYLQTRKPYQWLNNLFIYS